MIQENISLKPYNTFGIDVKAKRFIQANSVLELTQIIQDFPNESYFILSGGSNMLLTRDIEDLVIKLNLKGINTVEENDDFILVEASASEVWHDFVLWTLARNYGGLENLSLIRACRNYTHSKYWSLWCRDKRQHDSLQSTEYKNIGNSRIYKCTMSIRL